MSESTPQWCWRRRWWCWCWWVLVSAAVVLVLMLVGVGGWWLVVSVLVRRSEGGAAQFTQGVVVRTISSLGPVCMSEARVIVGSGGRFFAVARAPSRPFAIPHDSRCAQEPGVRFSSNTVLRSVPYGRSRPHAGCCVDPRASRGFAVRTVHDAHSYDIRDSAQTKRCPTSCVVFHTSCRMPVRNSPPP